MGKRKYDSITKIEHNGNRALTFSKRVKGLVKKAIELSKLCDQEVFLYVVDQTKRKVVHYESTPELDLKSIFDLEYFREFYSNQDYVKLGGDE
jgi:hypothetical protein